jgi:polysaccharide deacetylase 2 family uncharacterized protein YibQ
MTEVVQGLDRAKIAALRERGSYFWVDLSIAQTRSEDIAETLGIPKRLARPLFDFGEADMPSRLAGVRRAR